MIGSFFDLRDYFDASLLKRQRKAMVCRSFDGGRSYLRDRVGALSAWIFAGDFGVCGRDILFDKSPGTGRE